MVDFITILVMKIEIIIVISTMNKDREDILDLVILSSDAYHLMSSNSF